MISDALSTGSNFSALARLILRERNRIADVVIKSTVAADAAKMTLVTRSLVTSFANSLERHDPDEVIEWVRTVMVGRERLTAKIVERCCVAIECMSVKASCDLASLVVFLAVVKAAVQRILTDPRATNPVNTILAQTLQALKDRDEAACIHSREMALWCARLCDVLDLPRTVTERITRAGILLDFGKFGTPDELLFKPTDLTAEEWDIMKQHSALGSDVLSQIPSLADIAPIVLSHHERIDGTGYPEGRSGIEIPLEARVVAVADAFHAMISDRPYRPALTLVEAIDALARGRGTQWDAVIVDAMIRAIVIARNDARISEEFNMSGLQVIRHGSAP